MTLDEAIKHAEETAKQKFDDAAIITNKMKSKAALNRAEECKRRAEEHRQLAKWLKELKKLREQTRWIPVSERPPEDDGDYLVTMELTFDRGKRFVDQEKKSDWDNLRRCSLDILAWMPLPEPYGAESEE